VRLLTITTLALIAATSAACGQDGPVAAGTLSVPTSAAAGAGTVPPAGDNPTDLPAGKRTITVQAWFTQGEQLVPVTLHHRATRAVGRVALQDLLAGPPSSGALPEGAPLATQIPAGTRLLGLDIGDGIATVDLSREYESGGGTASMTMRLAQVVYTLTQFPTVKGVRFHLEGRPVNVFSGDGIVLDHPLTRKDYEDLLAAIVVEAPVPGARVASPLRIAGSADVFEANVTVRILDAGGREIARDFTTATCGTGCHGRYSLTLPFDVATEQQGTVVVSDDDADGDGHPSHEVRIPVTLLAG
jgi:germination protein M